MTGVPAANPLSGFLEVRRTMSGVMPSGGGAAIAAELSSVLDGALAALWSLEGRAALVAVGGYGRKELCLASDVDVMILHDGSLRAEDIQPILYPLWDARLKVGHSLRTLREVEVAAHESFETFTALLTYRHVAGSSLLTESLGPSLTAAIRKDRGKLARQLVHGELERRRSEPFFLLSGDVKSGRGSLRTLHTVAWDRARLACEGAEPDAPDHAEVQARNTLLEVRNALHAVAGRPQEVFGFDIRASAARWAGAGPEEFAERFQRARRVVDQIATERWPELVQISDPPRSAGGRWSLRALRRSAVGQAERPSPLLLADEALQRVSGSGFSPDEELHIRRSGPPVWNEEDRAAFVRVLAAGNRGAGMIGRMVELGWVERALPEWAHTVAQPQYVPFHEFTVDGHLWRTVEELLAVTSGESVFLDAVTDDLGSADDLLVAGFFHDVGKGLPGDHATVGAGLTRQFLKRAHFRPAAARRIELAVRHHLLLPDTAMRRDLDDPSVIAMVARTVDDPQMLRLLYLLSIADWRATGQGVFTAWKSSLLQTLFVRVLHHLGGALPDNQSTISDIVEAAGGAFGKQRVAGHLDAMPAAYGDRFSPDEIARHLVLTTPFPEPGDVRLDVKASGAVTSLLVVSRDRPGFLADMAGVLALHDIDVLDARLTTGSQGLAVDVVSVQDALGGGSVPAEKWVSVRNVLKDPGDLEADLAAKRHAYRHRTKPEGSVEVRTGQDGRYTTIEVRGPDSIGMLHDIARIIFDQGGDIHLAKIDTRAGLVIDVFYVVGAGGRPLTGEQAGIIASAVASI
ncbi:MAG: HD domain-containing protein [Acidimicrobiia bacterium]|nr:HD domain-containing protein [Acidimicrobiia bacterium]